MGVNSMETKKRLSQEEIVILYEEIKKGNTKARNVLVEKNLGLVRYFVKRYLSSGLEYDDLVVIGEIGLIKGIDGFDVNRGTKLSSYIGMAIENEILMALRKEKKHTSNISIDDPIGHNKDGEEMTLEDILGTEPDEILDNFISAIKIDLVREALKKLTSKEQKIILLRYGLDDKGKLTQEEVGLILGESRSNILKQEQKALIKMRHPKITSKLKDFID
jgi:RNA polymerase sporulation-specific sigma factor